MAGNRAIAPLVPSYDPGATVPTVQALVLEDAGTGDYHFALASGATADAFINSGSGDFTIEDDDDGTTIVLVGGDILILGA
jgi:hypothetical protein